jgi:cystathionine beta-synthase
VSPDRAIRVRLTFGAALSCGILLNQKAMESSVLNLIGNTPVIKVTRFDTGRCELFLKLENQNPTGSIKDRIALAMIEEAERKGLLRKGSTIIEAGAGNTALGLALVAALKGYKLHLVIPDKMSQEKILTLRGLGAEVTITRSDVGKGHPEYYQDMAERLSLEIPNSWYTSQFSNNANPQAHEASTGPEIWRQIEGDVDAIVAGVGSGGTLTGLSRFFKRVSPKTEMVLADPVGSILDHYISTGEVLKESGSWVVEGAVEDFIPPIADLSSVTRSFSIPDAESIGIARELFRREGVLGGTSSGLLLAAALRYCKEQQMPKRVVTFVCDTGNRYITKMFNSAWLQEQGLVTEECFGDLRDLVSPGVAVAVQPTDTLLIAYSRMQTHGVSQLPVLQDGVLVGIVDEWDLLHAVQSKRARFSHPIESIMTTNLETLPPSASVNQLVALYKRELVPIVVHEGRFLGVITKIDYLKYLRRRGDE